MTPREFALDFQWPVQPPFLFCVHHLDRYPKGTAAFGPEASLLAGRDLGQDFDPGNGFRMYHGMSVPGFPAHPHRGFETITIVRRGFVDHADSLGAAGRYGEGDVQWMTAGSGVQHSEMFPLLRRDSDNTLELFQIWLNLPKSSKMVAPHFKMFWADDIPKLVFDNGRVRVDVIAGDFGGTSALAPPPDSWAAGRENGVAIWLIRITEGGTVTLPVAAGTNRTLYHFEGDGLRIDGQHASARTGYAVSGDHAIALSSDKGRSEILILQAKPIGEPVFQHGPFVMNSRDDIIRTIEEYQRTGFGGWPWPREDMVHGDRLEKFAKYPDGRIERPRSAKS